MATIRTYIFRRLWAKGAFSLVAVLFAFLEVTCFEAFGQDRLELGFMGGVSYYNGDFNPTQQFLSPGPAFGFLGRYVFNDRLAAKATVSANNVRAKDLYTGDVYAVWGDAVVAPREMEEGEVQYVRAESGSFSRMVVGVD